MTNLQDALFPPIEEQDENEKVIFELFDEIKSNPHRTDLAVSAAVLVQQEIDMWKERIAQLESPCRSSPEVAVVEDEESSAHEPQEPFPLDDDDSESVHIDMDGEELMADQ